MAVIRLEEVIHSRAKALRAVLRPDAEYFWRKVTRWACEALNISIFEAERMPINVLLRHYYETRFEDLEDEQIDKVLDMVLETPAQAKAREQEEDQDDAAVDDLVEMVRREAEALAKQRGEKLLTKEEAVKVKKKGSGITFNFGPPPGPPQPQPTPPGAQPPVNLADLPSDVSVKFEDPDGLTQADWDLLK